MTFAFNGFNTLHLHLIFLTGWKQEKTANIARVNQINPPYVRWQLSFYMVETGLRTYPSILKMIKFLNFHHRNQINHQKTPMTRFLNVSVVGSGL
jgi:hypothetical protein